MKPKVLLVYPTPIKSDAFFGFVLPPLGLERIAARIESIAEVRILDLRFEGNDWLDQARNFHPDYVGVNVKTTVYSYRSYFIADRLKAACPDAKVILGGLHASAVPEEALAHGDVVVIGEGEEAMADLVQGKALNDIPGVMFKTGPTAFTKTAPRPLLADLDDLPPPARHLRPPHYRYMAADLIPMDLLETSRGCDRFCSFCSPAVTHHGVWRPHSPEYVFAEVQRLWKAGARYVMLTDDHFSGDLVRAKRISELITGAGIRIAFFCFLRPFLDRMDVKRAMVNAGFVMLSYGAESPSAEQVKRYGKGIGEDPATFINKVNQQWHEAGARYIGNSFVFGDPRELPADLHRFGDYARDLDPTYIEPLYSQPFPGTRYRQELEKAGELRPHNWSGFTEGRMLVKHPQIDEERLRQLRVRLWLRFFSPRKVVGGFRVPLYFHHVVGLPVRTVLKYMKACDYSVFGCILEDKFYLYKKRSMVKEYFREHINTFSPHERDMTPFADEFTDMLGLGRVKKWLGETVLALDIIDAGRVCTRFTAEFSGGRLARLTAGLDGPKAHRELSMRLEDVVSLMCGKELEKFSALIRTTIRALFSHFFPH